MSITTIDNQLLHYEVLGRGQPMIFIHGWLGSWRYWWPSMQSMSTRNRTFAIDLWGFGDSSKPPELYSLSNYVEMINKFIDKLGIAQPISLVGHALGAAVALRYTREYPEKVNKLMTVSLPVQGDFIHKRLATSAPDAFSSRVLGKSYNFSEVDSEMRKTDQLAMNQSAQELQAVDFTEDVITCARPLLLISGNQDQVVHLPVNWHASLQNSESKRFFVPLEKCNHFPMLEEKVKFNRLMLDFIHADDSVTELAPKDHWQRRIR